MKKNFAFCMLFIFVLQIGIVFAVDDFRETALYYGDADNNGKIDTLEIHFNDTLQGSIDLDKLILYSNTGGLSSQKLDDVRGQSIFSSSTLSGNILMLALVEQDLYQTGLIINNTTNSYLRLKTNAGVGVTDLSGKEIKLLYGSSFSSYSQVFYKDFSQDTSPENPPEIPEIPEIPDEPGEGDASGETIPPDNSGSGQIGSGIIIPPVLPEDPVFSGGIDAGSGSTFTGELFWNTQKIFQSPSYILEKDIEKDVYLCDTTQQECRVNFQILVSESGSEFKTPSSSKYICEWSFGDPQFEEEKDKCNPNTITFPVGEFQVGYTVFEKNDLTNKITKNFSIKNTGYVPPPQKVVYIGGGGGSSGNSDIHIQNPVIELQSGLDENNFCVKNDCGVNFIYEPKHEKERCLWDFSGGNYSNGTLTRCNPGIVTYSLGSFEVKLKVYELGKEGNYKTTSYLFVNKKIENLLPNSQTGNIFIPDEIEYQAKITLQGTQNKTKYMEGKNIFCLSESCNLNFDGRDSVIPQGEKIKYEWDFGNGKSFSGVNPSGIDFGVGKYEVIFFLFSSSGEKYSENIFVNVGIPEEKTLTSEEKLEIQEKYPIIISGVFPNPNGKDTQEFIEFSYSGKQKMSLSNCEMRYGDTTKQKTFLFPEYFFLSPGENKKLYQFDSQITLKNSGENILVLFCEGQKIDELMWTFQVPEEFILQKSFFPQEISQIKKNNKSKQFQIIYKNGDEKIVNFHLENTVYNDFLKEINSENFAGNQEEKQQRIQNFINQTFYQKISKQKKGVKIYGNTFPNTAVMIELEKTNDDFSFFPQAQASLTYETISDNFGSYEAFISIPPKGEFEVKTYLKSGENAIFPIEQSSTLEIDDDYLAYISEKTQGSFTEKPLLSLIEVQGKNTKTKTISSHKVVCRDVEKCSVNFDGRKSQGNNLKYLWDYGNGKIYHKSNPGSYNFGPGKHVISLKVSDGKKSHTSYFLVEVTPKPPKVQKTSNLEKAPQSISEKSSFQQQQTFDSLPMKYHFFYSGLIFLLFLILSGLVLRQKNII